MSIRKIISKYSYIYPYKDSCQTLPISTNKDNNKCLDFDLDRVNFIQPIKTKPSEDDETQNLSVIDYYDDIMMPKDLANKRVAQITDSKKTNVYYSDKV